jgi:hypothetical protein
VRTENDSLVSHQRVTEKRLKEADKEREKAEKRMETFKEKCETIRKEWQEEKEVRCFESNWNMSLLDVSVDH